MLPAGSPNTETPDSGVTAERLVVLLYAELRRLASSQMRAERAAHTLTPTALVHEAFMKLAAEKHLWQNPAQFFTAAAEAMRRVLINHAVKRKTLKRGGNCQRLDIDGVMISVDTGGVDPLELEPALAALQSADPDAYRVVLLRYFSGLGFAQIADMLEVNERTCKRRWERARLWLLDRLGPAAALAAAFEPAGVLDAS